MGAAFLMSVPAKHTLLGYPALALLMFLLAAALGIILILNSLLGDRRAKPRADRDQL